MAGSVPGGGRPLIITEDPLLLDDLLRLCAAAGADPHVHHAVPEPGGTADTGGAAEPGGDAGSTGWESAPLVLVGDDAARRVRGAPRRAGVLLVGRDLDDPHVWQRAVEIGAEEVLRLPDAESRLVDRLADVVEGAGRPALAVGVIGGSGGAGASTLACALAVRAARAGERTILIDGDPLGGGMDVLLGGESAEGLRWPDFAASRGRVGAGALEESLPELHDLRVLSWDRGDRVVVPPAAIRSVVAAARRRGGVVVVDLPRRVDEAVAEVLAQLDLVLMVVPGELRSVAAAGRVVAGVRMVARDVRVVVRGRCAGGLDPESVAGLLGAPLAGEVPVEVGLPGRVAEGEPPGTQGRGALARFCDGFWQRALGSAQGVPA
ncbi:septum site-determining protein Ssd [Streptomyces virginiae]|uniref:septum site-determining protein Ssd n=1 Tax=Streptomyces virginiae TaxID=1961 RepID=UPI00224D4378|nr:septum site-determining protein Ssd [Streptomyces virginiae]MCX4715066.1 septum formation initiator [Streptomyces virginiae]MCX5272805.1 septum formation initiator [Streptomyces virginiae]